MKRTYFFISTLLLVATLFLSNESFTQDYVWYKTLTGHTLIVSDVVFSPDGQIIASGSYDGTIHLWDTDIGIHLCTLTGHTSIINSVSFSPDGKILASGSWDKTIRLWDVATGKQLDTLIGHTGSIECVLFSSDGKILASGSRDKTIRLWDVATGKHLHTVRHTDMVWDVSFSPDGKTLASGSWDKTIRLWDVATGKHLRALRHTNFVFCLSFSPDGKTLASGLAWENTVCLWDVATGKRLDTLIGHTAAINSVSFSPDGKTLASGSWDKTIRLWNVAIGRCQGTLIGHTDYVNSIVFSPDGKTLASGSWDKTIRLWRVSSPQSVNAKDNPFDDLFDFDIFPSPQLVDPNPPTSPNLPANQVYDNAIRSIMWIVNPGVGEGSGVLIDKKFRFAVTNAHVTGTQNTVDIYFPAPDENGELIKDRNFYLTSKGVLKRLGYYTKGHVVAKNEKTDLAIIRLDGLPETAREIDWNLTPRATTAGDLVYILGNPAKHDLWRWTLGEFLNDHGDSLHIQSDVFGGNSGGPVLNKQGILIGIVARSDRHMNALAIPVRDINRLLSKSQLKHSRSRR